MRNPNYGRALKIFSVGRCALHLISSGANFTTFGESRQQLFLDCEKKFYVEHLTTAATRRAALKLMARNWIASAIKHPGALHRTLGVKQGKKIPVNRLRAAAKGNSVTAKRARLALTLRSFHH